MDNITNKCYNEDHPNTDAIYYCIECKISMCNKCESFHSKLFKNHNKINLDKNKDVSEIFTGFCKEKNHFDKLDYYCKNHNKLCCAGCISKLKIKDKGQHSDCEICSLEDIKESKEKLLKENILNLEKLSKDVDKLINEMKVLFEKVNKDKEELKLNIQKIFTRIRNAINDREDEILLKVNELFDIIYIKENEMNEIDKYPNKIKDLLKQSKNEIEKWNNNNKNYNVLGSFLNSCINIEKSLLSINNTDKSLKQCKNGLSTMIKFSPSEENEINEFISEITSFGKVSKENKVIQIHQNESVKKCIDFKIKSTDEELKGLSIKIFPFSKEEYNIYYPNDAIFKDDELILTLHLDVKNEFLNEVFKNKDNYENTLQKILMNIFENEIFSLRKKENKLFLDILSEAPEQDKKDFLFVSDFILNHYQVLMNFQNNLSFEKMKEINFNEFVKYFTSLDFSIKGNIKNYENIDKINEIDKKNIDNNLKELIYGFNFCANLLLSNMIKFKWDISLDQLNDLMKYAFKKEYNYDDDKINENFEEFKRYFEKMISMFAQNFETSLSLKMSEDIIYDKILVTLLFSNFKSGYVLEITSQGINDYLKNILDNKNENQ